MHKKEPLETKDSKIDSNPAIGLLEEGDLVPAQDIIELVTNFYLSPLNYRNNNRDQDIISINFNGGRSWHAETLWEGLLSQIL